MRQVTATEKYRAVNEGKMAKREFVRQMRQSYPMYVSQYDGFDSTVQILKNKGMLFEAAPKAFSGVKVYDDRPALTYSLDALERGIRIELESLVHDFLNSKVSPEDYLKAEKKAKDNLEKDANHYLNLLAGESNKVDKHDKEKEVKRGAADKDTFNDMKKATLKEGMYTDDEEWEKEMGRTPEDTEKAIDKEASKLGKEGMSEDAKKNLLGKVVGELRTSYPMITPNLIKEFIKDSYQGLLEGSDTSDLFEKYIKSFQSEGNTVDVDKAADKYSELERDFIFFIQDTYEKDLSADEILDDFINWRNEKLDNLEEKTDQDKDGDNDFDDIKIARMKASGMSHDDAVKKVKAKDESYAMKRMQQAHTQDRLAGKKSTYDQAKEKNKEQEKQLKEAIKGIIKKSLLNEAATAKLADWGEGYEGFEGVKPVVNELENIVTEIEVFYDKISEKIAKTFEKTAGFRNEEGLKIGAFIAPSLESAFKQDLRPVTKKGFFGKVQLPQVRRITQADVDAHNSGARPLGETEIEEKSTVYTPNF